MADVSGAVMRHVFLFAALTLLPTVVAQADTRATEEKNLARFEKFAGQPVESFDMWDLYKWQSLGPDRLAVWSAVNKVWLLKVSQPCIRLEDTHAIVLTSQMVHKVTTRFDYVNFDAQHCQIQEIRPVDYLAMIKAGESGKATAAH
jgi:hypothetical protein